MLDISGPQHLENKIREIDGRVHKAANGNAWKCFRVFRQNQDLGLIWDLREKFHLQRLEEDEQALRTGQSNRTRRAPVKRKRPTTNVKQDRGAESGV